MSITAADTIAVLLTLIVLSRAFGDNPIYRAVQSVFIGTSLGVAFVIARSPPDTRQAAFVQWGLAVGGAVVAMGVHKLCGALGWVGLGAAALVGARPAWVLGERTESAVTAVVGRRPRRRGRVGSWGVQVGLAAVALFVGCVWLLEKGTGTRE